ncbi:MAG: hypothetical protein ACRDFB_05760, partial [Rhabdochlamydiaceae bacterium]
MGSLCQIAGVITSLALLQLGHVAYAVTSLTILSLGYLRRRQCLPLFFCQAYNALDLYVGDITNLLYGNWISKFVAVGALFDQAHHFFQKRPVSYDPASRVSHLNNYDTFKAVVEGEVEVKVNREHIWIAPFPHVATTNFSSLQTFCNNFKWDIELLSKSLVNDPGYQDAIGEEPPFGADLNDFKIKYATSKFNTLVTNVQEEKIETGEILNYNILKQYLGFITENLPSASLELQQQIMIQLAIDGGNSCGPGIYYQLETAATALLCASKNEDKKRLPLEQRILLILQQERLKIIQAFHMLRLKKMENIDGKTGLDPHGVNYTIQLIGSSFGLPDQGADQDTTADETFIAKKYLCWYLGMHPEQLWIGLGKECQGYSVQRICDAVKAQIGIPLIPKIDVYEWAQTWIKKDSISEEENSEFTERLTDGESYEDQQLRFKDNFLKAM